MLVVALLALVVALVGVLVILVVAGSSLPSGLAAGLVVPLSGVALGLSSLLLILFVKEKLEKP